MNLNLLTALLQIMESSGICHRHLPPVCFTLPGDLMKRPTLKVGEIMVNSGVFTGLRIPYTWTEVENCTVGFNNVHQYVKQTIWRAIAPDELEIPTRVFTAAGHILQLVDRSYQGISDCTYISLHQDAIVEDENQGTGFAWNIRGEIRYEHHSNCPASSPQLQRASSLRGQPSS